MEGFECEVYQKRALHF